MKSFSYNQSLYKPLSLGVAQISLDNQFDVSSLNSYHICARKKFTKPRMLKEIGNSYMDKRNYNYERINADNVENNLYENFCVGQNTKVQKKEISETTLSRSKRIIKEIFYIKPSIRSSTAESNESRFKKKIMGKQNLITNSSNKFRQYWNQNLRRAYLRRLHSIPIEIQQNDDNNVNSSFNLTFSNKIGNFSNPINCNGYINRNSSE